MPEQPLQNSLFEDDYLLRELDYRPRNSAILQETDDAGNGRLLRRVGGTLRIKPPCGA